ncbi:hypothetical protein Tsubulata_042452 [Turnera subulata]|uniref:PGG domain-containing protein n=1 Tax=Turnera subulata TaxID=218843 RepID=A0A9Q0FPW7_9ROSI|nr:hypothetical protein Tsubulata_042452 [Turnera subulata]
MEAKKMNDRQKRLYEAAVNGDVQSLNQLVKEDQLILARVSLTSFDETPLHIAAMLGHLDFARALLHHRPDLAAELNSQGSSPLHLASTSGFIEIAKVLISANPDMCVARDEEGRTPLHLAVMKGRVDIIEELVRARPEVVRYTGDRGETLLQLAVKHNRVESLKLLLGLDKEVDGFVNSRDDDGNTVLHTATSLKQIETVKYLISSTSVKVDAENGNGFTTLDIIENMPRDLKVMEIRDCLLTAGALRSRKLPESSARRRKLEGIESSGISPVTQNSEPTPQALDASTAENKEEDKWLEHNRGYLMITAALIAVLSYYLALNPPGGTFDRYSTSSDRENFRPGKSILAVVDNGQYNAFFIRNTVTFISSLTTMVLLVIGFPIKQIILRFMIMTFMFVSILSLAITYFANIAEVLSWEDQSTPDFGGLLIVMLVWFVVVGIVLVIQVIRFIVRLVREQKKNRSEKMERFVKGKQGPDQA